jgi:hypothetical protein
MEPLYNKKWNLNGIFVGPFLSNEPGTGIPIIFVNVGTFCGKLLATDIYSVTVSFNSVPSFQVGDPVLVAVTGSV